MNIKPPYSVAVAFTNRELSKTEAGLLSAIDNLMRSVRICEFIDPGFTKDERNAILQKHTEAAFDYYSRFSPEDMAKMLLAEELIEQIKAGGEENE